MGALNLWAIAAIELVIMDFKYRWKNGAPPTRDEAARRNHLLDETFVLVDRLKASANISQRLVDSLELCFRESHSAEIITADNDARLKFSDRYVCKYDNTRYETPEPNLFSFNSPFGACPTCQGFGNTIGVDYGLVVPNPLLSLKDGAVDPFTRPQHAWAQKELLKYAASAGIDIKKPFADLDDHQQNCIIYGDEGWRGIKGFFEWLETKKYKLHVRVFLAKYRGYTRCPDCGGGRLRQEARDVKIGGRSLPELLELSISDAARFFDELEFSQERAKIAEKLLLEIRRRLKFLVEVGLEYLTLNRLASTLSGGEAQRIQLATNLGSLLVGTLYVLDEPSIGLHPRDNARLIKILEDLRDIGNTLIVVEHDEETIRSADHIIDIGPFAGELGGEVIFEGTYDGLLKDKTSLTARYLRDEAEIKVPQKRRKPGKEKIKIVGAREHNLKNISVEIPLEMMVCITGVSGSGKSTLVHDILFAGLKKQKGDWNTAIRQELDRGGQVFYVVPRVEGIEEVSARLREMIPGARIAIAHGQMMEGELEATMLTFSNGEADILVCTTIIESGLDIPRVNTILIEDAQKFGLAQLYQLRGRVGRAGIQAHAWLFYPKQSQLTDNARQRLRAIQEFTQLGSGYQLAVRDMEIRGVGNLLGAEQSGQMDAIGFDLYMEMLEEAIKEIRGQEIPQVDDTQIDLNLTAFIPADYIPDLDQKMSAYRAVASAQTKRELAEIAADWNDRYGAMPPAASQLLRVMELKQLAKSLGFSRIKPEGKQHIVLETPMEEPAWNLLKENLPGHLQTRFIYTPGKVTVRGLGVLKADLQLENLLDYLNRMKGGLPEAAIA
ncbi:TRCF domain-containing protein [Leptolyngbya sp. 7M]|uniref:TRCF domain-containing protein n=1 Tax=Leptolyngbya sp. 7M TaxID=2812896 RepID=UPI001B8C96B9|nr:TRCF domain-containing protein [Leptolyngbya sp. 7M]QYO64279.1 hypothetical protein JVX88_31930 [Leptolyngbya sp. 7M]